MCVCLSFLCLEQKKFKKQEIKRKTNFEGKFVLRNSWSVALLPERMYEQVCIFHYIQKQTGECEVTIGDVKQ